MRGLLGWSIQSEGARMETEVEARPQWPKKAWIRSLHWILWAVEELKGVSAGEGQTFRSRRE